MYSTENQTTFKRYDSSSSSSEKNGNKKEERFFTAWDYFFIFLIILEMLIVGLMMALNYLFRYNSSIRYSSDMVDFNKVLLPCDASKLKYELSRPYFDYGLSSTKSLEGLELQYDLPEWVFFLCLLLTPIAIFCLVEISKSIICNKLQKNKEKLNVVFLKKVPRITKIIGGYLLGGSIAGLFTCVMKFNITSPRPHFMSVCLNNITDSFEAFCQDHNFWRPSELCFSEKENTVEALKSFPSYHATLAVYSAVFTSAYIVLVVTFRRTLTGPVLFTFGLMVMGFIGATHRLSSGYSFPGDIFAGAFIGFIVAYYMVVFRFNEFQKGKYQSRKHFAIRSKHKKHSGASDFDSDGSSNYENFVKKTRSYPFLPRIQTDMPLQAVNPTMQVDTRTNAPRNPPLPMPKKGGFPARSHSSVSRTWTGEESANSGYNIPRQRQSAPAPKEESVNGYTNYGFTSTREPRNGVLSAYSPATKESFSRF